MGKIARRICPRGDHSDAILPTLQLAIGRLAEDALRGALEQHERGAAPDQHDDKNASNFGVQANKIGHFLHVYVSWRPSKRQPRDMRTIGAQITSARA